MIGEQRFFSARDVIADALRRARRPKAAQPDRPTLLRRSLDDQRVDERNVALARGVYFNLAIDRAKSHCNAAPVLGELFTMQLQETALRDAADMLASRIRSALDARTAGGNRAP